MNVLIILGHPRTDSFCAALSERYKVGAAAAGAAIKTVVVSQLQFEKNVVVAEPENQYFENDLVTVKKDILWADHLVFIFPTWWGSMPGILKSFIDRVFTPNFAFNEKRKWEYEKLLSGKTAQLIITMDTPVFVYRFIYKAPGQNLLANATLKFCGVSPVRAKLISPVKYASAEQKEKWLDETEQMGKRLQHGVLSPAEKTMQKLIPWLKALRLQFYPMTFIAYATGAFAARSFGYGFNVWVMVVGYLFLFLLEAATVFSNEYYDYESDVKNKNYGLFNGGSRVLADKLIHFPVLKRAIYTCLICLIPVFLLLIFISPGGVITNLAAGTIITVLALGYTVPPLKLSWRSLGETDVAVTHSIAVMLFGFVLQGGNMFNMQLWLVSLPLFFSILPAIILSGIPDYDADKAAGKKTIPVKTGVKNAILIAAVSTVLATLSAVVLKHSDYVPGVFGNAVYFTIPHAFFLCYLMMRFLNLGAKPARIDLLMVISLLYIFWFGIIPLIGVL